MVCDLDIACGGAWYPEEDVDRLYVDWLSPFCGVPPCTVLLISFRLGPSSSISFKFFSNSSSSMGIPLVSGAGMGLSAMAKLGPKLLEYIENELDKLKINKVKR